MKVVNINKILNSSGSMVKDCCVDKGYVKVTHGSLPDIDSDFAADRRDEVKTYLEKRYNLNGMTRVFSAGTFTTIKIKSGIKDVARVYKVPVSTANYLTAMLEDDMTWTDFMRLASTDKRIHDFVQKYPDVLEELFPIMGQPRSAGIHASAVIITPKIIKGKRVDCFDLLPIKQMGDLLVSEINGNDIDSIGILKNDVLGIRELTRLSDTLKLIKNEYGVEYDILEISSKYLNDPKVFSILRDGCTQGIFQMSGDGMTRFIKQMKPENIEDLIAANALFRPATLSTGSAQGYIDCKNGVTEPSYLWGTYNALKVSFGNLCYQEQVSLMAREVGGLSLGDGVNLVKAVSKKKIDKIRKYKDKFLEGSKKQGCPQDAAKAIWDMIEASSSYLFNRAHATAYGLTAYVGAWLKTYYPTAFYTVILRDQKEEKMAALMNEIRTVGGTELCNPDINISDIDFTADFKNNRIYWSLTRIKHLGAKSVQYIVNERKYYGEFDNMEDFIQRIFKRKFSSWNDDETSEQMGRCPVTVRSLKCLIYSGAFDKCENIGSIIERYGLMQRAATLLGFEMAEGEISEDLRDKHYYWAQQQISVAGIGKIDYKRIVDNMDIPVSVKKQRFIMLNELDNSFCDIKKGLVCATICDVVDKTYKDNETGKNKHFGKITLQQNTESSILTIWDAWSEWKGKFKKSENKILITVANTKYSEFDGKYVLQVNKGSYMEIV